MSDETARDGSHPLRVENRLRDASEGVRRALDPTPPDFGPVVRRGRQRRRLAVALPTVLVVALLVIGVRTMTTGGDDDPERITAATTAAATASTEPAPDDPAVMWGRLWELTDVESPSGIEPDGDGAVVVLDMRTPGMIRFEVCNDVRAIVHLDGDRIRVLDMGGTLMGCMGWKGEMEVALSELFRAPPTVELRDDRLTLRSRDTIATFDDVTEQLGPTVSQPLEPASGAPTDLWGRQWLVRGVRTDDHEGELEDGDLVTIVDATVADRLTYRHRDVVVDGSAQIRDDTLVWESDGRSSDAGTVDDGRILDILRSRPTVTVRGQYAYLVTDTGVLSLYATA